MTSKSKSSRIVKLALLIGVIVVVFLVFLIRDTYEKLSATKFEYDIVNQQLESVSAQLQVVYEHKSRLENSLELEKNQHKKTKDDMTNHVEEQKLEASAKYATLQQQYQMLKSQHEDLESEFDSLSSSHQKLSTECSSNDGVIAKLRENIADLEDINGRLSYDLKKCHLNGSSRPIIDSSGSRKQAVLPSSSTSSANANNRNISSPKQISMSPHNSNVIHKPNSVSEKIKSMDIPPQDFSPDVRFIEPPGPNSYDSQPDVDGGIDKDDPHVIPPPST